MSEKNDNQSRRRQFFREALARMLEPVTDYIDQRSKPTLERTRLRPPGAIEESEFVRTCVRCGSCADVCPARAIFLAHDEEGPGADTPYIDASEAACVVCEGIQCTHVCPSGALQPLTDPSLIRMGVAEVYEPLCVRTEGQACVECVEKCPLGSEAIGFNGDGPPEVITHGCVGCGVCQLVCPTTPKAITVRPL